MENKRYVHELPREAGITAPLPLTGCPFTAQKKQRLHILALGDVGTTLLIGLRLLGAADIESIGICDLNEKNLSRLEMEINQIRYPFAGQGISYRRTAFLTVTSSFFVPLRACRL